MGYLNRTVDEAIAWAEGQHEKPSQDWHNLCQSFCRQAYGVDAWASSAKEAWNSIPKEHKVSGGSPFDAARGELIYFDSGTYGHVALAIGKTTNDNAWSNDYVRDGKIDKAPRNFPNWGLHYAGRSFWTPYGEMQPDDGVTYWDGTVPPKENVDYAEDTGTKNKAAWRLACRLADLGYYSGAPQPCYEQGYPTNAVASFQKGQGWDGTGKYGQKTHDAVWP